MSDVRRYLRRALPDYMIPSMIVHGRQLSRSRRMASSIAAALPDPFRSPFRAAVTPAGSGGGSGSGSRRDLAGDPQDRNSQRRGQLLRVGGPFAPVAASGGRGQGADRLAHGPQDTVFSNACGNWLLKPRPRHGHDPERIP